MIRTKPKTALNVFTSVEYQRLPMSTVRGIVNAPAGNGIEKVYKFTAFRYRYPNTNTRFLFEFHQRARGGRIFVANQQRALSTNLYFCYTRTDKGR